MKRYGWNNTGILRYQFIVATLTTHFAFFTALNMMLPFSLISSTTNTPTYTSQWKGRTDVLINITDARLTVTTIYRKKTFTSLFTKDLSFSPFIYKMGLPKPRQTGRLRKTTLGWVSIMTYKNYLPFYGRTYSLRTLSTKAFLNLF